jgi:acetyl esterase/lipase
MIRSLLVFGLLAASVCVAKAAEPQAVNVWPGDVPGEKGDIGAETATPSKPGEKQVTRVSNVTRPTITIYAPPEDKRTKTAVLICPGGGYSILAIDLEGEEVARWLNGIGVTGIVLKYRVPARKGQPRHLAPLQDAQRAMSLVRSNAEKWGLAPDRLGILGFSAGGHLSAAASTNFDQRQYAAIDDLDKVSCRPDFTVLVYPAYLANGSALADEIRASPQTPPTFLIHAGDDRIAAENSVQMYLALRQAKVPAELHTFPAGGHGFGLRPSEHPISGWPKLCEQWMQAIGKL